VPLRLLVDAFGWLAAALVLLVFVRETHCRQAQ